MIILWYPLYLQGICLSKPMITLWYPFTYNSYKGHAYLKNHNYDTPLLVLQGTCMITQLLLSPENGQNEVSKPKHIFSLILGSGTLWAAVWSLLLILRHFEGTFRSPFWFFWAPGQLQSGVTSWILGVRRKFLYLGLSTCSKLSIFEVFRAQL